jgi:hypothetical protein
MSLSKYLDLLTEKILKKFNKFDFNDPYNLIALDFISYEEFDAFYNYVCQLVNGNTRFLSRWGTVSHIKKEFIIVSLAMSYLSALDLARKHRPFESGFPTGEVYHTLEKLRPEVRLDLKPKFEDKPRVWIDKNGYIRGFSLGEEHFRFTESCED